jgi:hypothetical protein
MGDAGRLIANDVREPTAARFKADIGRSRNSHIQTCALTFGQSYALDQITSGSDRN